MAVDRLTVPSIIGLEVENPQGVAVESDAVRPAHHGRAGTGVVAAAPAGAAHTPGAAHGRRRHPVHRREGACRDRRRRHRHRPGTTPVIDAIRTFREKDARAQWRARKLSRRMLASISSSSRRCFTTSPMLTMPWSRPSSTTGR